MIHVPTRICLTASLALASAAPIVAFAQKTTETTSETITENNETYLGNTSIFVQAETPFDIPGSGVSLNANDTFTTANYDNAHQALRRVPGVYIREEDGYGLFPNISIRGVDSNRSSKISLLEDGIPVAPAPYSAPEAYYAPTLGRMHAVEVIRGSGQVMHGPQTSGGVVNYVSTSVPTSYEGEGYLRAIYGSDNEVRLHAWYGQSFDLGDHGTIGYLLEGYYRTSDGFREYDFEGTPNAGFERGDVNARLFWEPKTDHYNRFELNVGYTDMEARETYLGLTEEDANNGSHTRYAATQFDIMDQHQSRINARWILQATDDLEIRTTGYYHNFARNWYKLDHVSATTDPGIDGRGRITGRSSLSSALLDPGLTDVLQGNATGSIGVKANNREYEAYGAQIDGTYTFDATGWKHELTAGTRIHHDRVRRAQWVDVYNAESGGAFSEFNNGTEGDESNRLERATSWALFAQNRMEQNAWGITAGIRAEQLDRSYDDYNSGASRDASDWLLAGGISADYQMNTYWQIFAGAHNAFATASPSGATHTGLDKVDDERSWQYELGSRWADETGNWGVEAVAFYSQYDDLIVAGADPSADGNNGGDVNAYGLELAAHADFGRHLGWEVATPTWTSVTWTKSEFGSDVTQADSDSIFFGANKGNDVPYVPELQISVGFGVEDLNGKWGVNTSINWVDEVYTSGNNVNAPVTNAREGRLDSRMLVDLQGFYKLNNNVRAMAGIQNLFDESYTSSRLAHGPRVGQGQTLWAGFEVKF